MNPWPIVALLVALLAGGNIFFAKAWLGARDGRTKAETQLATAKAAAKQCSESVAALQDAAKKRQKDGKAATEKARQKAVTHETRAQEILSSPQAIPGDSCKSADAAINDWIERRKP